jgi:hypothetical protein
MNHPSSVALVTCLLSGAACAATLQVGPGRDYQKPSQAAAAARDGDVVEIASGVYSGDTATWRASNLVLRGIGGRAHLKADGHNAQGKAIWVIAGSNTTVENIEFSGARVPDRNGAGIRQEGAGLVVRNCHFHDNEEGILTGANPASEILVESSEFAGNGFGDGLSHNMYIGKVGKFTLRCCYTHNARVGHLVKSRAMENYILYNRITDEGGTASYEVDLPNGGKTFLIGNMIEQGAKSENSTIVSYAEEGGSNPSQHLYVSHNTIVNDRGGGVFVRVAGSAPATATLIVNNAFAGPGTLLSGAGTMRSNLLLPDKDLPRRAGFDYHLAAGSAAIDAAGDPGSADGFSLAAACQYVHPLSSEPRTPAGQAEVGAFERAAEQR